MGKNKIVPTLLICVILSIPLVAIGFYSYMLADSHFIYTLDDPYIHLAIAENIAHGTYGVNAGEFSSSSSSILWPFILAIFYPAGAYFEYVPLIINGVLTIGSCLLIFTIFNFLPVARRVVITMLLAFSTNVYALAFTGMEHSLQVFLTLLVLRCIIQERYHVLLFISLALLPLIRYECVAISLPVLLFLFIKGKRKEALITLFSFASIMVTFSVYLYSKQQNPFPISIIAKTFMYGPGGLFVIIRNNLNVYGYLLMPGAYLILQKNSTTRNWGILLFLSTILYMLLGRNGGFVRYEVFFAVAVYTGFTWHLLKHQPRLAALTLLLPLVNVYLMSLNFVTPRATSNIYRQHAQMGKIACMLNENVAINDLGYVALKSPNYVLDFWGVGSNESLQYQIQYHGINQQEWMDILMQKHKVHYAMIYSSWVTEVPKNWIKVGELTLLERNRTVGGLTIGFYGNSPEHADHFRKILNQYQKMGPPERVAFTVF